MKTYRIRFVWFGWEPQTKYTAGWSGKPFWTPLNRNGYWAEPDSYNFGQRTGKRYPMSWADARTAIERSKRINESGRVVATA